MTNHFSSLCRDFELGKYLTRCQPYFVLIPLLAPKGLESILPWYKSCFALWSMAALAVMVLDSVSLVIHRKGRFVPIGMTAYCILAVITSVFSHDGMNSGLQKLFLYPAVYFYFLIMDEDELRKHVIALAKILCFLLLAYFLSPSSLFVESTNMTFLGHIQVLTQYGFLAIYVSILIFIKRMGPRFLGVVLGVLGLACLVFADTDSAHYCLFIFTGIMLLSKFVPSLSRVDFRYVVIFSFVSSVFVVIITVSGLSPLMHTNIDWSFNGRAFVWSSALTLIKQAPMLGYGVENAVIATFWSPGMNYAHNQVIQCMLDGGIILFVSMVFMLCSIAGFVNRTSNIQLRNASAAVLCSLLFFMIFDCFTQYSYVFILLALVARGGMQSEGRSVMGLSDIKRKFSQFYYARQIKKRAALCEGKVYTGGKSYVTSNTYLSDNVCFNGMEMSGNGKISVGANFHSGPGCQIITSFHDYDHDDAIPYGDNMIDKDVTIGDNVWFGNNVIVLGGVTIGEGAIIQAGSVVCRSVPAYSIAGGHPAVPFKQRDIQHYERLKSLKRFH